MKQTEEFRAFQIIKTIEALNAELDALRPVLHARHGKGGLIYVNAGKTQMLKIGDSVQQTVFKDQLLNYAELSEPLKNELVSIALKKLGAITVKEFDDLVKRHPHILDAKGWKNVRQKLSITDVKEETL